MNPDAQNTQGTSSSTDKAPVNIEVAKSRLPEDQWKERAFDFSRLFQISQVRESPQPQFDGMGYMMYNQTNEMADMSFIAPKKNKMDSRLVTGITHEKDSSLLSLVQSFNFEGRIRVYKGSEEQYDLGVALTDSIRATREKEDYDRKRPINYRNILVQGTSFVIEKFVESFRPKKVINDATFDYAQLDKLDWVNAGMEKIWSGCTSDLVDGKKIFLEDIRQADIQKQPGVYIVEYVPRETVRSIWGKNARWQYVPYITIPITSGYITQGSIYSDYTFAEIDTRKIEVVQVFRRFENRYQIYLNGIPMLKTNFPLTAISPSGLIPIAKGDLDQMNLFAYSKSIPSKTKVDQAVFDEVLRLMLIKFQQSAFVPSVNNTGKVLSPDIYMPGRMNQGFDAKGIQALIEKPGLDGGDFNFFKLMSEQIDLKSISSLLEGNAGNADMTLGQYMDMQKKQLIKLGSIFDAIINWEKQMLQLRTMNFIAAALRPDKNPSTNETKYPELSVGNSLGGVQGSKIIKFQENINKSSFDVFDEQQAYKKNTGNSVEISYLDPVQLKELINNPEYTFRYEIVPVDKNNDKITQIMFVQMITQASQLFGPDSLNVQELKQRYASVMGEEFDTLFIDQQQMVQNQLQKAQQATAMAQNTQFQNETKNAPPGLNALPSAKELTASTINA